LNEGEKWDSVSTVDSSTKMVYVFADFAVTNSRESNSLLDFVQRLNKYTINDILRDNHRIKKIPWQDFKRCANKQIWLPSNVSRINNFVSHDGESDDAAKAFGH
jgi:hypothetical protein